MIKPMVLIMLRGKVHNELSQTGESSIRFKIKALFSSMIEDY